MTKSIEDYPGLKEWYSQHIVETRYLLSEFHFGFQPDEVEEKLLEMQKRIDELEKECENSKDYAVAVSNRMDELKSELNSHEKSFKAMESQIIELEKEKYESIEAWSSKLEKLTAENAGLRVRANELSLQLNRYHTIKEENFDMKVFFGHTRLYRVWR